MAPLKKNYNPHYLFFLCVYVAFLPPQKKKNNWISISAQNSIFFEQIVI